MNKCFEDGRCVFVEDLPGDCHIACTAPDAKPERMTWPGCGIWPLCFDSSTIVKCSAKSTNPEDKAKAKPITDPLMKIAQLLSNR